MSDDTWFYTHLPSVGDQVRYASKWIGDLCAHVVMDVRGRCHQTGEVILAHEGEQPLGLSFPKWTPVSDLRENNGCLVCEECARFIKTLAKGAGLVARRDT